MADTLKRLAKGIFGTGSATLYTAPASTTTTIRYIHIHNANSTSEWVTLVVAGTDVFKTFPLPILGGWSGPVAIILNATETITGLASKATGLTYYISGVETV